LVVKKREIMKIFSEAAQKGGSGKKTTRETELLEGQEYLIALIEG